jgi:hypothetical protein
MNEKSSENDSTMAGIPGKGGVKGKSGPSGNTNAFKHGLAAIQKQPRGSNGHRTIESAPRAYSPAQSLPR